MTGPDLPEGPDLLAGPDGSAGLDGLDPRWSRTLRVPDADGVGRTWHLLDNVATLGGREPVGTVLCVHGNPTWSYLWRHVVAAAAAADRPWRVVAVDQLGMGFSERTGTRRRLARRIDDLGRLTDALDLSGPVVTLGHDWGGVVSLGWALAHRDRLAGVALLNTAVHQPAGSALPGLIAAARLPGVRWAVTAATSTFVEGTLALAHPRLRAAVRAGYRAPYRTRARRAAIDDFVEDIPVSPRHPSWNALEDVVRGMPALATVPALLLWGPRDPVFGDLYLHDLRDRLPHAAVHRFERAGHLVAEDADVAGALTRWLAEVVAPAPSFRAAAPAAPAAAAPAPVPAAVAAPAGAAPRRPLWSGLEARSGDGDPALVEPAGTGFRTLSWAVLADRVDRVAAGLESTGVRAGDRVALLVPPGSALTVAFYACLRIGAVVVVADAGLGLAGLGRAVRGAGVRHVIAEGPGLLAARALRWPGRRIAVHTGGALERWAFGAGTALTELARRPDRDRRPASAGVGAGGPGPDQAAMVAYTSGATGPAKGVVYTHRQLEGLRDLLRATYGLGPDDRFVAAFAPFALFGPALGMTSAVPRMDVTAPRTLTATALADAARAAGASVVFGSPAALANVVATGAALDPDARAALAGVRLLLSAGAPVPPGLLASAAALMPAADIRTPYGMTEALLVTDVGRAEIEAAGPGDGVLVGRPLAGVDVAVDPLGAFGAPTGDITVKAGVTGEVLVRAAHVKESYDQLWLTQLASADPPGWHRTGDVGHLDDEGRLRIEGRTVHVVTTADGFVTPVGVEQRVETLPQVARAALVGVGPGGAQQPVVVLEVAAGGGAGPAAAAGRAGSRVGPGRPGRRGRRARRLRLADAGLTARVRAVAGTDLAAVLVTGALPTDVRHNAKIDRVEVARRAGRLLAGARGPRPGAEPDAGPDDRPDRLDHRADG